MLRATDGRPLIGCRNCEHQGVERSQMVCRFMPPTTAPMLGTDDNGKLRIAGWVASFPPVAPDLKCGQHKLRTN